MLRDRVSWKLFCLSGIGGLKMLARVWGGQREFFGEVMAGVWGGGSSLHSNPQQGSPLVLLCLTEAGGLFYLQCPKPRTENPMVALPAAVSRFQSEQSLHAGREGRVCHPRVFHSELGGSELG